MPVEKMIHNVRTDSLRNLTAEFLDDSYVISGLLATVPE